MPQGLARQGLHQDAELQQELKHVAYAYLLTPTGIVEKAGLTVRFLARKVAEFESLTLEIEALKSEVNQAPVKSVKG